MGAANPDMHRTETAAAPPGVWRRRLSRLLSVVRLEAIVALLVNFIQRFDHGINQPAVDGLWLLALLVWGSEVWAHSGKPFIGVRMQWRDVRLIAGILVLFAAAWLPFYDNWRWAY